MNIGGLLTRSFGTGTTAFNQGERDALTRMRDRQAFVDEEEARQRRAKIENVMSGIIMPTGPVPLANAPTELPGLAGAEAVARIYGGTAGVAPAGAAPAAGVAPAPVTGVTPSAAPPTGVSPPQIKGRTAGKPKSTAEQYYDKEILSTLDALANQNARINQLRAVAKQVQGDIGRTIPYSEGVQRITQLEKEIKAEDTKRQQLADRVKYLEAGRISAAPTPTKVGVPPLLAKPDAASFYGDAQFRQLAQAVMQAESGGDPNAVSPKGAVGRMQVMPETLLAPGYGIAPARDNSDAENVRVGTQYLAAMLKEFNGNTQHALAAYNWGPGKTKEWIAKGAKFADLPKETQAYISKVTGTPQLGATSAAAASNEYFPPNMDVRQTPVYIPRMEFKLQTKSAERKELERQALAFRDQGLFDLYAEAVTQLRQLDSELVHLQGMVGLGDIADDPRATQRLSLVMSHYRGKPPGYYKLQPRSDGKYNEIVNGKLARQGLTMQEVADSTRMIFDEAYAASVNATRAAQSEAAIKLDARTKELVVEYGLKNVEAMTKAELDRETENIKGAWSYSQAMNVANIPKDKKDATYTKATLDGRDVLIASTVDPSQQSGFRSFILTSPVGPNGEPDPTAPPYWLPLQKPPR